MKKKQHPPKKKKDFSSSPFTALQGLAVTVPVAAPPQPVASPPPPPACEEDLELFYRAVSDVRPLADDRATAVPREPSPATPSPVAMRARTFDEEDRALFLKALEGMDVRFEEDLPDEADSLRPISANRIRQLKEGALRISMELDLHGLTRDEALEGLGHFISGAWRRGMKAVLVITGKGNNSPGEPVLQAAVAGWLRDKGKKMVVEFAPAPRQMGGTGAFVVFLREHDPGEPAQRQ